MNRRVERTRTVVMDAGAQLLLKGGPSAVTVDALVHATGVARSTFYRHWPTREEYIVELFDSLQPRVAPIDESLGFEGALRAAMASAVEVLTTQQWRQLLPAIMLLRHAIPRVAEVDERQRAEHEAQLAALLRLGEREGLVRPGLSAKRVLQLLTGPLLVAALAEEVDDGLIGDVVDRFLAAEAMLRDGQLARHAGT